MNNQTTEMNTRMEREIQLLARKLAVECQHVTNLQGTVEHLEEYIETQKQTTRKIAEERNDWIDTLKRIEAEKDARIAELEARLSRH